MSVLADLAVSTGALLALIVLSVAVCWLAEVALQVREIREGRLDPDDGDVIGAARWWATGEPPPHWDDWDEDV